MRGVDRLRAKFYAIRYRRFATFGERVRVRGKFKLTGPGPITIGDRVTFDSHGPRNRIWCREGGSVAIGADGYLNGLDIYADHPVEIGERCLSGDCWITTSNFHSTHANRHVASAPVGAGPVTIGPNVWLANRTAVLPRVTIGEDSVVAFGTVVTKDVPSGVIVAGQEVRVVRQVPRAVQ